MHVPNFIRGSAMIIFKAMLKKSCQFFNLFNLVQNFLIGEGII